jgi:DnaJ domain
MAKLWTHYDTLEVARSASTEVIKGAYKYLSQKFHPDRGNSPDASRMQEINVAYGVLKDAESRRKYDEWLASQEAGGSSESPVEREGGATERGLTELLLYCDNSNCPRLEGELHPVFPRNRERQARMLYLGPVDVGLATLHRYYCPHCDRRRDYTAGGTRVQGVTPGIQLAGLAFRGFMDHVVEEERRERERMANPVYAAEKLRQQVEKERRERRNWLLVYVIGAVVVGSGIVAGVVQERRR